MFNVSKTFHKSISSHLSKFVQDGIINDEQKNKMLDNYSIKNSPSALSIISTIGAILIGTGFLVFIAGNWSNISPLYRMLLLFIGIITIYLTGIKFDISHPRTAFALRLLTAFLFGGSLFLTDQTFNLNRSVPELFLLIVFGIIIMNLAEHNHKTFYILEMLLLSLVFLFFTFEQFYLMKYLSFIHWLIALLLTGISAILFKQTTFSSLGINITSLTFGFAIISLFNRMNTPVLIMTISVFIYGSLIVALSLKPFFSTPINLRKADCFVAFLFMGIAGVALTFPSIWNSLFYLKPNIVPLIFTIIFFAYLLFLYNQGYHISVVFIITLILRFYFDMLYSFMPKSLFFIIGGIILIGSGWYMERKRKKNKNKKEDIKIEKN